MLKRIARIILIGGGVAVLAGFGGHVDALYEHVGILRSALAGLVPGKPPPVDL
jgi:hypothetical protein